MSNKEVPKEIQDKIDSYIYKMPEIVRVHMREDVTFGYSLALEQLEEKQKEIERLKGLLQNRVAPDLSQPFYKTLWEHYKIKNNL
jgi:hypothetical protein